MSERRAVTFPNRSGEALFGIVDRPARSRRDLGIILLSPGVKSRVAPHRLYYKLAERFATLGFAVLRFDFAGLGDSEGVVADRLLADLYRSIQLGRYTGDTLAAVDWMREHTGCERVILGGLCGGAITGLLAARHSPHVAGLLSVGMPVGLDGASVDKVANMSQGQLREVRRKYLAKLTDRESWVRALTLRTDFRLAFRSLLARRRPARPVTTAPRVLGENGNPEFSPALLDMLGRRRPVLLAFGGADRLFWEYQERFQQPHQSVVAPYAEWLEVQVIPRANHVLTAVESQDAFFQHCEDWLARHFPGGAVSGSPLRGQQVSA